MGSDAVGTIPELKQVGPKKWRARVLVGYEPDPAGGYPIPVRRQKTFTGTKTEARNQLLEFVNSVSGTRAESHDRLETFLERWLAHIAADREPTTMRGYRSAVKAINTKLGHLRLDRLDAQAIDHAYAQWLAEGRSRLTVRKYHQTLSAALTQAWRWDLIPMPPTQKVRPPSGAGARREPVPITVVRDLIVAAENSGYPALAALIALDSTTGLRRGELCGLRWGDVDLMAGTLKVVRAVKARDDGADETDLRRGPRIHTGGFVLGDVKTHLGRTLTLDPFAVEALKVHRRGVEARAREAGLVIAEGSYIFSLDPAGRDWYSPTTVTHHFHAVATSLGVTATLHGIRHTVATTLLAQGFDLASVAKRLGHADGTVTMKVYAHALAERDQAAADLLGRLIHGGPEVLELA